MRALPMNPNADGQQPTGVVCPNCSGAMSVRFEGGRRMMSFQCRVGHIYALTDLLASKEEVIETRLWRALYALEEYADLLDDLEPGTPELPALELRQRRSEMARQHARALRAIVEVEQPLTFDTDEDQTDLGLAARGRDD